MEIDVIRQFAELMDAFGIKVTRLSMGCPDENDPFDTGLRSLLYEKYDYREGLRRMEEYYEPGMLYLVKDVFEIHYMSFLVPESLAETEERPDAPSISTTDIPCGMSVSRWQRWFWNWAWPRKKC